VAGLIFVLIFGRQGYLGPFLWRDGYSIMPYLISFLGVGLLVALYVLFRPINPRERRGIWNRPRLVGLVGGAAAFGLLVFLQQYFEVWPRNESLKIIFATPGLILATAFVTCPFVARELIPVMEATGADEELAAVSLGANGWRMFWRITLPLLRPTIIVALLFRAIDCLKTFDIIYVMTQGGPGFASETLNVYTFQVGLFYFHIGYASSLLVILFALVLGVSLVLIKVRRGSW